MITKDSLVFFSILQMVVVFAMIPLLVLSQHYGQKAVLIYAATSLLILFAYAYHLWRQGGDHPQKAELGSLGFGMIMAFLSAEIVAVTLVIS